MIDFKDITKTYGSGTEAYAALRGISFSINEGEFVAIMGPSGSGKSTLMHILGCLDTPTSGTYRLDGKDVSTMSDNELADVRKGKIGFVFQSFNLLPRTTVLRNVMLPLVYAGVSPRERENRATAALNAAGLTEEHFTHLSNQLSGGQIQRVAIARALVNDPALILADEPTGNLDSRTSLVVLDTLQKLNRWHGRTIVLITHEPDIAEHSERIIRLRDGSIISDEKNPAPRDAARETELYDDPA
ncbi:ABC transporter ATP-binding protein [Patescibacteria group bacterium]|nr:ABC transporter ATP-binding protein [Patescibacteria group bacterium]MDE2173213.1 ABC transporter ATP-binding protein [Patescibacteria group bacterium]